MNLELQSAQAKAKTSIDRAIERTGKANEVLQRKMAMHL